MNYSAVAIKTFLDDLAARKPTPGGGSASALGGAIAAALAQMAGAYTRGNEKFKAVEPRVKELLAALEGLRGKMTELMEKDIAAYASYSAARAMPKDSDDEKKARSAALAVALEESTRVPEDIVHTAERGLELTLALSEIVNPALAGDVAVAAYFFEAAASGAGIQVISNCAAPDKEGRNAARRAAADNNLRHCHELRTKIHQTVLKLLKVQQ